MAKPYVFTICYDQPDEVTFKECRKNCFGAVKLSKLQSLYDAGVKAVMGNSADPLAETLKQLDCKPSARLFDPLAIVCDLYNTYFKHELETCMSRKKNLTDCVYGCYSGVAPHQESPRLHSHQRRNYKFPRFRDSFSAMDEAINRTIGTQTFTCFDDIITYLEQIKASDKKADTDHKETFTGFGDLSIYDAAQRIAWHAGEEERLKLLPTEVYLHQGVLKGAAALWRLGLLPCSEKIRHGYRVPVANFPAALRSLPAFHLENLLCIFHSVFEEWSPVPERKNDKLTNQKNNQ